MVTWPFLVIQVHTSSSSEVADHCSVHALSDLSDKDLSEECDHQHDQRCSQCDALDNVLVHIENLVPSADFYNKEDKDEASYRCRTFVNAIHSWKSHQLRSVHQDLGPVSRKSRELFGPEKPFIKLRAAYSVKPVF